MSLRTLVSDSTVTLFLGLNVYSFDSGRDHLIAQTPVDLPIISLLVSGPEI